MRTLKGRNMNNSPRSLRHAVQAALVVPLLGLALLGALPRAPPTS
jgi:hypothetical protein